MFYTPLAKIFPNPNLPYLIWKWGLHSIIKLKILRRDHLGIPRSNDLGWSLNWMTGVLSGKRKGRFHTHTGRKTMWRQRQRPELPCHKARKASSYQKLEEREDFPLEASEGAWSWRHHDFRFLVSRTMLYKYLFFQAMKFLVISYGGPRKQYNSLPPTPHVIDCA